MTLRYHERGNHMFAWHETDLAARLFQATRYLEGREEVLRAVRACTQANSRLGYRCARLSNALST
eukprot:1194951-Prorocentrum_minimum.AAC.3